MITDYRLLETLLAFTIVFGFGFACARTSHRQVNAKTEKTMRA